LSRELHAVEAGAVSGHKRYVHLSDDNERLRQENERLRQENMVLKHALKEAKAQLAKLNKLYQSAIKKTQAKAGRPSKKAAGSEASA
jgi:cell division septum initiation protein DivIVA